MTIKILSFFQFISRRKFTFVIFLSAIFSLVEIIGISAIMPFIQSAMDFTKIHSSSYLESVYSFLGLKSDISFIKIFAVILIGFYIFRFGFHIFYYKTLATFARGNYYNISNKLFNNYIHMPYKVFKEKNSAHLIQAVVTESDHVSQIFHTLVLMLGEVFTTVIIYIVLLMINWKLTFLITGVLGITILLMSQTVSKWIKQAGESRANEYKSYYEILTKTFGNFKMIKLQTDEESMIEKFAQTSKRLIRSYIQNETIQHIPRLFLEALSFILIIGLVLYWVISEHGSIADRIGVLTLFIVALYRLMPSFNRLMTNYNGLLFHLKALDIVHHDIHQDFERYGDKTIIFSKQISLKDVSYSYDDSRYVIKDITLDIKKDEKVAFVGESGSGKSTIADIIMGLLLPTRGEIYIDDMVLDKSNMLSWRSKIGYIPQDIYLFDGSVAENVAFLPKKKLNVKRVETVLRQAKILDFLQTHQQGLETVVGEGGVKLSGGQKQRIAIARALYHDPELLVLDEATSALDEETERAIMKEIYEIAKDKTMIIIAHRLSTIEGCDRVYKFEEGKIFY